MSNAGPQGRRAGLPYDFRRKSGREIVSVWWQPDNPEVLVPKSYGWGYTINFARLFGRARRT